MGEASWHDFSCEIVNQYNMLVQINGWPALKANAENIAAISTADYPTPAARPANSRLDNGKLKQVFGIQMPEWQQGLLQVMQSLTL